MNTLIAYFTHPGETYVGGKILNLERGNTQQAADRIREMTGGKMYRIEPIVEYEHDYSACLEHAMDDQRRNARPALKIPAPQPDTFEILLLGYPNWWGTMPMPVFTFLEELDLTGKVICPFCTHAGGEFGRSLEDIKRLCPAADIREGLALSGSMVHLAWKRIREWLKTTYFENDGKENTDMITHSSDTITLYNGLRMPGMGFGVWQIPDGKDTIKSVKAAIAAGYRNIDTAQAYHNEEGVGEGIRQAMAEQGVRREELFISTKVWNSHRSYDGAMEAFEESMKKLGLSYLDLYMIHWPAVAKWHDDWRQINAGTWRALEQLYKEGRVKAIGVCNYLAHHLQALMEDTKIKPMVNQIEYHPGFGQTESAAFCQENGIVVEAWSPFGTGDVLNHPELLRIAGKYGKTSAQICLRWLIQKGIVPLPKSVHEERIRANTQVFDFALTEKDMVDIDAIPYCGGMRFDPNTAKS